MKVRVLFVIMITSKARLNHTSPLQEIQHKSLQIDLSIMYYDTIMHYLFMYYLFYIYLLNPGVIFSFLWRILGSLISSHILLTDPKHPFGKVGFEGYDNELLHLAHDLAVRLLPAFENTRTGIPYPRVSATLLT